MWFDFFAAALVVVALLYIPGFFAVRALSFGKATALAAAPAISTLLYCVFGIVYGWLGVPVGWWAVVVPAVALSFAVWLITSQFKKKGCSHDTQNVDAVDLPLLALYAMLGMLVVGFVFVKYLNGAASFAQLYDNAAHLNTIESMVQNGNFSVFASSLYSAIEITAGISPTNVSRGFYPASWHIVTALSAGVTGVNSPIAENASLMIFMGLVFPLSLCLLLSSFFKERKVVGLGSLFALAFTAFPWGFLTFGPLYSNLAAYCVLPIAIAAVVGLFDRASSMRDRLSWVLLLAFSGASLALLQPNAIFVAIILGAPFCVKELWLSTKEPSSRNWRPLAACSLFILTLFGFWWALWQSSAFNAVVSYPWPAFEGKMDAAIGAINLSLRSYPPQWLLAVLVLFGALCAIVRKQFRFLVVSYVLCMATFVVCASSEGALRSFLAGFWYNDAYRIAANVALASIPLAAYGAHEALFLLWGFGKRVGLSVRLVRVSLIVLFAAFVAVVYRPTNLFFESNYDNRPAFEVVNAKLNWLSAPEVRRYTEEEATFVEQAKELSSTDPGGIVNVPYDGSVFSYGADGAEVMFRSYSSYGDGSEKPDSILVREELCHVADNKDVVIAVNRLNAKYVLLLDCGGEGAEGSTLDNGLAKSNGHYFNGVASIDEQTPGFKLLLAEGDMRFYKITG